MSATAVIEQGNVSYIRDVFAEIYMHEQIENGKLDGTLELANVSFIADDDHIFGRPDFDYIKREIAWYESQSLNVNDIAAPVPKIWKQIASPDGYINSNYGYLLLSEENGNQFDHVVKTLIDDPSSRQAVAVYTRPSIHEESKYLMRSPYGDMHDFICTNTVQYMLRDHLLLTNVQMRSNDAVFGYRNDVAWQVYAQHLVADSVKKLTDWDIELGPITWQVGSLHVYPRHFPLVARYCSDNTHDWAIRDVLKKQS